MTRKALNEAPTRFKNMMIERGYELLEIAVQNFYEDSEPADALIKGLKVYNYGCYDNFWITGDSVIFPDDSWTDYYFDNQSGKIFQQIMKDGLQDNFEDFHRWMTGHRSANRPKGVRLFDKGYILISFENESLIFSLPLDSSATMAVRNLMMQYR